MDFIKPKKIGSKSEPQNESPKEGKIEEKNEDKSCLLDRAPIHRDSSGPLTASEMGKLWAAYMGNSMSTCILKYFLQHVEDEDIKQLVEDALQLSTDFVASVGEIFKKENFPIPIGFSDQDVNLDAPRLFEDEFYVHYLKYAAKAGLSIYHIAIPLLFRKDITEFFIYSMEATTILVEKVKNILMKKKLIIKPPVIPVPEKAVYVHKDFLNGYLGKVRPLHALEITHLYDNIENNVTSKALILGFCQVAESKKVRELFIKGKVLTQKSVERYIGELHKASLPTPQPLDHLVKLSTVPPFSDKLMLFHKMDMFSMKLRAFGNSIAVNGRHDIGLMYGKSLMDISIFVEEAARIMLDNGWFEQPPLAVDREHLKTE
ncbi:DUF3231 family protein [Peribacillus kribbensis]|uniref:DUF3231 family protein n=1 Tax=Peribacillus kribbensis TaxID=356658 RepID=UPI000416068D